MPGEPILVRPRPVKRPAAGLSQIDGTPYVGQSGNAKVHRGIGRQLILLQSAISESYVYELYTKYY